MRRVIIIILLFVVGSCEKDDIFDDLGFYGEGTAFLNGMEWNGKTGVFKAKEYCFPDTCIGILIVKRNQFGELRSEILIDQVLLKSGKFQLNKERYDPIFPKYLDTTYNLSYHEYTSDGDVGTGYYRIIKSDSNNYIEIKELNKITGNIKGTFRARVVRDSFWTAIGSVPDTIDIEDGNFYGKINWK